EDLRPIQVLAGSAPGTIPQVGCLLRDIGRLHDFGADGKNERGQEKYEKESGGLHRRLTVYIIPGSRTSIPFSAIFKASGFGATSKAVGRSINSSSIKPFRLMVKSCMPSSLPMRMASTSFSSAPSRTSLRTMGLKCMISTVGTR